MSFHKSNWAKLTLPQSLIAPPLKLDVDTWADTYRKLSPEASSEVGQWNTDRAPFQRGMMRAVTEKGVKKIVFMTSAQVGKSEIILNVIGYMISMDPGPIIVFQPSSQMAESFSKDRLSSMLRDTPILQGLVKDARLRGSDNTLLHKKFKGGQLTLSGIQSSSSVASRPIRTLLIDECDRAPLSSFISGSGQKEGDPIALAEMRTNNFHNSLIILASTPTKKNHSRIEAAFLESDQRRFHIACPHCNHLQTLKFLQLKWQSQDPETTRYECESCNQTIDEKLKHRLLLAGQWIAGAPFKGTAGFHISELYSPWRKWKDIVAKFLKEKVSPERLQVWVNTTLGQSFEEKGEAPDWKKLYDRREAYPMNGVQPGVLLLTAGADIQKDGIYIEIVGWCEDKSSYSLDYRYLPGNTMTDEPWKQLSQILSSSWKLPNGLEISLSMCAIDSGYNTSQVYAYVRTQAQSRVMAIKGISTTHFALGQPTAVDVHLRGKRITRGAKVWPIGVNLLKGELFSWLKLEKPLDGEPYPAGYCHFPEYSDEYFKQLTAEQLITKSVRGYSRYIWEKTRPDNHALDCRVYARAAANALGLDRMTVKDFKKLKVELGLSLKAPRKKDETQSNMTAYEMI
jgi:phage terminase large subunit GpA-like protein